MTEKQLSENLHRDADKAFAEIYHIEWQNCIRIASILLWQDEKAAEDVVQESFFSLWRNRNKIDEQQGYRHWLYRCVRNQAIDYLRKRKPATVAPEKLSICDKQLKAKNASKFSLSKALTELSDKQRIVILLKFWQGFSIKEIAKLLQIPQGTVGSRLSIGLQKLAHLLRSESP